jgi:hypothetical protein
LEQSERSESQKGNEMQQAFIVSGSLKDERTVTLDEPLPQAAGKVRVIVEMVPAVTRPSYSEVIAKIRSRQQQRGFSPPTREEVDAYLQSERSSWDE